MRTQRATEEHLGTLAVAHRAILLIALSPAILDEVVKIVEENFFDPRRLGSSWAQRVDRAKRDIAPDISTQDEAIDALLASLAASHTHRYTENDLEYFHLLDAFRPMLSSRHPEVYRNLAYVGIGVWTVEMAGRMFVSGVFDRSPAQAAGIRAGDELLEVDGRLYSGLTSLHGTAGRSVEMRVRRRADGPPLPVTVRPVEIDPATVLLEASRASATVERVGERRVAYVRLWSFAGEAYRELIEDLIAGKFAEADAMVLDLRGGLGGANPDAVTLFDPSHPVLEYEDRSGKRIKLDRSWRKPAVLVIDETTRSGKEVLAYAFRRNGRGPIVGEPTAGAVLGGRPFILSDGSLLYLATFKALVDGAPLEGNGVRPDLLVPFDIRFSEGRDPQKERAMEIAARDAK